MATVLITTDDLERAVELRDVFEPEDRVEFIEDPDEISGHANHGDAALVLTGNADSPSARRTISGFHDDGRSAPVIGLFETQGDVSADLLRELGLDEHFVKPIDPADVALVVRRLIERRHLQEEIGIVGRTEPIQEAIERIAQMAPVGSTVLITGESGTGKELAARGLHKLSPRRGKAFIPVNIAALPETLLESELFGHEKGAFTGASALRKGMFELANGGTIFLDEIAEMPPPTQTKLLRVLEQREFMRVGGTSSISVDVRVIAATNRDLRRAVALEEFRRDLYYRLNVLHIHMPSLRERRDDIPLLVHEFIDEFSREHQREFKGITPEAMEMLVQYDWPGNVRELRNLVESMVVLAPGTVIRPEDIPTEVRRGVGELMLPTRVTPSVPEDESTRERVPEIEFIFRTLVELKLDIEDIRREFESYKREHPELVRPVSSSVMTAARVASEVAREAREVTVSEGAEEGPGPSDGAEVAPESEVESQEDQATIAFEPGMTMQELERAAIIATLESVDGNRRRAAEQLGIGERTLYRKLKEYEIDA